MSNNLTDLDRAALRLEITAAQLTGAYGRQDLSAVTSALEDHQHNNERFRHELELATGIKASQIQRLLNI